MKIVIDSAIPFIRGVFEPYAEVVYCEGGVIGAEQVKDCDALVVRTRTRCNSELLGGSRVRFIATATIGRDHIDEEYCRKAGIEVVSAAGCNARGVLQWVAAALKTLLLTNVQRPEDCCLGVVGVGNVGSLVVEYARNWGFEVLPCDPPRQMREGGEYYSIDEVARRCDIITFHTPLDASTHHLVDKRLLSIMRPNTVIINASRGAVVDNVAMAQSSHPYIFDVWENEPNLNSLVLDGAMLATPHIAGYSLQGKANATSMVVNALSEFFKLPIVGWYPDGVQPTAPTMIDWDAMCRTVGEYCPICDETRLLKSSPDTFEKQRNEYNYRAEYF